MGISRLDGWAIQSNEVSVEAFSDSEGKNYGMFIYLLKDGEIDRLSVSTNGFPYSSEKEARTAGKDLVNEIRGMDIGNPYEILEKIVGEETAGAVVEIIDASRGLSD